MTHLDFSKLTNLQGVQLISDRLLANFAIKYNIVDPTCLEGLNKEQQINKVEHELKTNKEFSAVIGHAFEIHLMTFLTSAALKLAKKSSERAFK